VGPVSNERVRPFYEKLGAVVVDNRIVNSLADNPAANPFWDEVVMRYPAGGDWPSGAIDLRGPGYGVSRSCATGSASASQLVRVPIRHWQSQWHTTNRQTCGCRAPAARSLARARLSIGPTLLAGMPVTPLISW